MMAVIFLDKILLGESINNLYFLKKNPLNNHDSRISRGIEELSIDAIIEMFLAAVSVLSHVNATK